jgi:hypothetical protein
MLFKEDKRTTDRSDRQNLLAPQPNDRDNPAGAKSSFSQTSGTTKVAVQTQKPASRAPTRGGSNQQNG